MLRSHKLNEYQAVAANTGNEMESLNTAIAMIRERNVDAANKLYTWIMKAQDFASDAHISYAVCRELVDGKERRNINDIMTAIRSNIAALA